MRIINVGIVGTGMAFEKLHYPAYKRLSDRYKIAAVCDADISKARSWASRLGLGDQNAYADWHDMVTRRNDLGAIDIMVPIALNHVVTEGIAKTLADRNIGIICEKPLAPNIQEAIAARDMAKRYNIPIMIAENYRYNQEIDMIRDMVRTKKIGDVLYFIQNRVVNFPADMLKDAFPATEWRQYSDFRGGAITDTALHDFAALHHIFGPVEKLQAFGVPQKQEWSPYSVVSVNLQFRAGVIGHFSFYCAGPEAQRPLIGLRIFGTQGMIYLEERDCGTINVAYNDGRHEAVPYEPQAGYYNELLNFHKALIGEEPISVTPELEFGDFHLVDDILNSIEESRVIYINEPLMYQPVYGWHDRSAEQSLRM